MSTPTPGQKRTSRPTIDLTGNSDDEVQCLGAAAPDTKKAEDSPQEDTQPISRPPALGILGLDRKAMEEERLARLKRKQQSQESDQPPAKRLNQSLRGINDARQHKAIAAAVKAAPVDAASSTKKLPQTPGLLYPNGIVKKTSVMGHPMQDDITISEVFQQHQGLELAVMSSFQWDMDWLFSKFDLKKSRYLLIMGAKDEETRSALLEDTKDVSSVRLVFPPMGSPVRCMHSKLMLLYYTQFLRIVVPSANLVPHDWGETGTMDNIVFLIDLPRNTSATKDKTPFFEDLTFFLRAQNYPEQLITKMEAFDFSATSRYAFVHTIGGQHRGETAERTGVCGLSRAVRQLNLATQDSLQLDYITSSLGSLTPAFLQSMYSGIHGCDLTKKDTAKTGHKDWEDQLLIYYPSRKTVVESIGGKAGAGTICFHRQSYAGKQFPRDMMRDNINERSGVLMHNKMLYVRPKQSPTWEQFPACQGWTYLGSANLSESAW
ncbi:hypothetical protein KEM56_006413 [Ascosphaera pollenicola]|nr:hypothetical protein KEM56_006413 [Ascosphaera pollenicola]